MPDAKEFVTCELCEQKHKIEEERFSRDKERIEKLEETSCKIVDINAKLTTLLDKNKKSDTFKSAMAIAIISATISAIVSIVIVIIK